jgi:hypothetical protein
MKLLQISSVSYVSIYFFTKVCRTARASMSQCALHVTYCEVPQEWARLCVCVCKEATISSINNQASLCGMDYVSVFYSHLEQIRNYCY